VNRASAEVYFALHQRPGYAAIERALRARVAVPPAWWPTARQLAWPEPAGTTPPPLTAAIVLHSLFIVAAGRPPVRLTGAQRTRLRRLRALAHRRLHREHARLVRAAGAES
jgi:hypothetical protein